MRIKIIFFLLLLFLHATGFTCTNLLITKGASQNGSNIITYAADSHTLYGELYYFPAEKYTTGQLRKVIEWDTHKPLGFIPEISETFNVVGNMNQWGLSIAETTFGGLKELQDTTGIIDYGSLIYITLQRAKNAREAIYTMAQLVEKHGYYSTGESFSIADDNEVWILEMIGKGVNPPKGFTKGAVWVAIRIPDGYVSAHANQARIQQFRLTDKKTSITSKQLSLIYLPTVETVYSEDVIRFAKAINKYQGDDKNFSFSDTYAPVDFGGARACDARVWDFFRRVSDDMEKYTNYALGHDLSQRLPLYIKPNRLLTVADAATVMRSHYEGTPLDMRNDIGAGPHQLPYRWRPMRFKVGDAEYVHERAIATQQTAFWFVSESRPTMVHPFKGVLWFGVDDAATSCLTPYYGCANKISKYFQAGNGGMLEYSPISAFWLFNRVTNFAYLRYDRMSKDILACQQEFEKESYTSILTVDKKLQEDIDINERIDIATQYSIRRADELFTRWSLLSDYLLIKYIDGNIKKEDERGFFLRTPYKLPVSPEQPELPEKWRKSIVEDTQNKLKVK